MHPLIHTYAPNIGHILHETERRVRKVLLGEIGRGASSHVRVLDKHRVEKIYREGIKTQEGRILSECPSPYFVKVFSYDNNKIVMERLGDPLGHWRRGILRVESAQALGQFLDSIGDELKKYDISHRDINPANILFDREQWQYKLCDFHTAKRGDLKDAVKDDPLELRYSRNDREATRQITLELREFLFTNSFWPATYQNA